MNIYPKMTEPFAFWLVRHFLPHSSDTEETVQPISNRDFYIYLGMTTFALLVFGIVVRVF